MNMAPDMERRRALVELLARPEALDQRRRHRLILEGRPDRHQQLPRLASAYVQAKLLELRDRQALREVTE
jgi:hypothetical protein